MAQTLKSAIFQNGEQRANFEWNVILKSAILQDGCQRGKFKYTFLLTSVQSGNGQESQDMEAVRQDLKR